MNTEISNQENEPVFDSVKITESAFKKILFYGKAIKKLTGADLECMGYLIAPMDMKKGVISDAVYYIDQSVTRQNAYGNELGDDRTTKLIYDRGAKIIGIWHNHASFKVNPSEKDNQMLELLVTQEEIYLEKSIMAVEDVSVEESDGKTRVYIHDPRNVDARFRITLDGQNLNPKVEHQIGDEINYRISLIINTKSEHYVEVGYQYWDGEKAQYLPMQKDKDLKLEKIATSEEVNHLELLDEVFNNTILDGKSLNEYSHVRKRYEHLFDLVRSKKQKPQEEGKIEEEKTEPTPEQVKEEPIQEEKQDISDLVSQAQSLKSQLKENLQDYIADDRNLPQKVTTWATGDPLLKLNSILNLGDVYHRLENIIQDLKTDKDLKNETKKINFYLEKAKIAFSQEKEKVCSLVHSRGYKGLVSVLIGSRYTNEDVQNISKYLDIIGLNMDSREFKKAWSVKQ